MRFIIGLIFILFLSQASAQINKPLILTLNETGSHYLSFQTWFQAWGRYGQLNPGSIIGDEPNSGNIGDISLRRFRIGMDGIVFDKTFVFLRMGFNNLNYLSNRGVSIDLLDAYAEYRFHPAFHMGFGKTAWGGVSRYSAPSASKTLKHDVVILAQPTINITDDLLRRLAVYFKGQVRNFDYRLAVFKPFELQQEPNALSQEVAKFTSDGLDDSWGVSMYFKWFFAEKEGNNAAFHPGTYLYKRKVINLGAGIEFQNDRTATLAPDSSLVFHNLKLFSVDFFANLPFKKEQAWTFYAAWFPYDYGPNYTRNIGVNNVSTSVDPAQASFNGPGFAYTVHGTGHSYYMQSGYYFHLKNLMGLQPYVDLQVSDYDYLDDLMVAYSIGMNWLIFEEDMKISFNYEDRPLFFQTTEGITQENRRHVFVIQYQLRID